MSDEVVHEFVSSICSQWGAKNGYPAEEFIEIPQDVSAEAVKRWRDALIEYAFDRQKGLITTKTN